MLTEQQVHDYLTRIGAARPERPDLAALRHLQERHSLTVPFESIDYHLGREIYMDERIVDKVVYQRRGGGCYEINTAFYLLLLALDFPVTLHQCRVWISGRFTAPHNHVLMTVRFPEDGTRWLADVGFGKSSRYPVRLGTPEPHVDQHGRFTTGRPEDGATDVYRNDVLQYRFYDEPAELPDFRQNLWWYRTHPASPFLQNMFCSLPTEDGRVTLQGDRLTVLDGGRQTVEILAGDDAVVEAYQWFFGISFDKPPVPGPYADDSMRMSFFESDDGRSDLVPR
ncbi:arylamine N-acetyltransferase [Actinoplanes sp. NPDC051411]|uniref:arylamine N-acetyltransferase family protein n=1 Tax=Actinoplanes sp. NPDC051411 TaxID=3155522 RepID=UPI003419C11A